VLGVHVDIETMVASIPQDKIDKAKKRINAVLAGSNVGSKPLEEMIGLLQWIGQILVRAGVHLPFCIQTLKAAFTHGHARVTQALRDELAWWTELLTVWNGRAIIIDPVWVVPAHSADRAPFTDACSDKGKGGGGAIFGKYIYACRWSSFECQLLNIYELEGFMHVLWMQWICDNVPDLVAGKRFITRCDNESFCKAVTRGRSSYPVIDWLLRKLHILQSRFSFDIRVEHVAGVDNECADLLSRAKWREFSTHIRQVANTKLADLDQVQIPQRLPWSSKLLSLKRSEAVLRSQH